MSLTFEEHALTFEGQAGPLEGRIMMPAERVGKTFAMLGHPHPLFGGTMSNKVVTTMARACGDLGIPSVRFNFRGVGASGGVFDHGQGESEDMKQVMAQVAAQYDVGEWLLAGFSFGSYVTYRVALSSSPVLLISIAPLVDRFDDARSPPCPWVILQGTADDVVDPAGVFAFAAQHRPALRAIPFEGAGHFFHGQLLALRGVLEETMGTILTSRV